MTKGERVKKIRKDQNLTLEKFGMRLGVTNVAISNIEKGNRSLTEQMALAICREYNVSYDWLTNGEGTMYIKTPQSTLEKLKQEYNLDDFSYRLICEYLELDETKRDIVKQFFYNVTSTEESPKDMDIDSMVEDYRRQLILEKKAAEKSGVSQKNG